MALIHVQSEYTIPRGRVYFDPRNAEDQLTGEQPFGNCPSFTVSISTEKAEHYSSTTGLREKDKSVPVQVDRTSSLNCDNISATVLAWFLSGSKSTHVQTSLAVSNEAHTVRGGRFYTLGQTEANPAGARNVSSVSASVDAPTWVAATAYAVGDIVKPTSGTGLHYYRCTVAGTAHASTEPTWPTNGSTVSDGTATWIDEGPLALVADTDFALDVAIGRFQTLDTLSAEHDTPLLINYTRAAVSWEQIKTGAVSELSGALRVISDNATGPNRDYYMPRVTLKPTGDLPVIADGTDFVSLGFEIEILKPANGEAIYADGRPVAA